MNGTANQRSVDAMPGKEAEQTGDNFSATETQGVTRLDEAAMEVADTTPSEQEIIKALQSGGARVVSRSISVMHQGPTPHPRIAAGWEAVVPGAADRLLKMSESALDAEIQLKKQSQIFMFTSRLSGQVFGTVCVIGGIYFAFDAIHAGMPVVAGTAITVSLGTLAGMVVTGRWKESSKSSQKNTDSEPPS